MTDDVKTEVLPIEPTIVRVIGGGTGDGGAPLTTGTVGRTPDHQPNIITAVVTPLMFICVRSLKAFVISLSGLLPVAGPTGVIPSHDFMDLFTKCVSLSVGIGITAGVVALGEVLSKLDQKFPTLGS